MTLDQLQHMNLSELFDVCLTDPEHVAFSTGSSILDKGFKLLKLAVPEQLFVEAQAKAEEWLDWQRTREGDYPR